MVLGAALKAIQAIELVSRGQALLPRVGDRSFPEFFMQRCTDCKRCTEECPFGAIDETEKGTPLPIQIAVVAVVYVWEVVRKGLYRLRITI